MKTYREYLTTEKKRLYARPSRTRHVLVPGRFQHWILPRLLPARLLDRLTSKNAGLLPPKA